MQFRLLVASISLFASSHAVAAASCEDSFQSIGDPRNGLTFMATASKPGLGVSSALGQLQQLGGAKGYVIGAESIPDGTLFLTQTNVRPPIVLQAKAAPSGDVALHTKVPVGMKVTVADARREMCGLLASLKVGKEGEAIAAAARAKSGSGALIDVKAPELSAEIGREVREAQRNSVSGKDRMRDLLLGTSTQPTADQTRSFTSPIVAKYRGRRYRIDGQAYTVSYNQFSRTMETQFLVTPTRGLLGVRQSSSYNGLNYGIRCIMARDQAAFFSTLGEGSFMTLVGTVDEMERSGMTLRDCRQAN